MTTQARGTFEVQLTPQGTEGADVAGLGRRSIAKVLRGDLEARSEGQMLSAATDVEGSAGYVAIELVTGTLHGRKGTFMLQHSGTMTRGAPQSAIVIVPDSGTGQLVGLSGRMAIKIAEGKHSYELRYTLPAAG